MGLTLWVDVFATIPANSIRKLWGTGVPQPNQDASKYDNKADNTSNKMTMGLIVADGLWLHINGRHVGHVGYTHLLAQEDDESDSQNDLHTRGKVRVWEREKKGMLELESDQI